MSKFDLNRWFHAAFNATTYLGVAMVALIWSGLLFSQHAAKNHAVQAARDNGSNLARAYEESVLRTISEIDKSLLLLRSQILLSGGAVDIRDLAADARYASDIAQFVAVTDADGLMTASHGPAAVRIDVSDREQYRFFHDDPSDRLFIGKPVLGRVAGQSLMVFARPILAADGTFKGVISSGVQPDALTRFFKVIDIGKEGRITLIGDDGIVRAAEGGTRLVLGDKVASPFWSSYSGSPSGSFYAQAFDGVRRLISYRQVKGFPLIATVGFSESEILADFLHTQQVNDVVACGITLLILAGIGFNAAYRAKLEAAQEAIRASEAATQEKSRELEITLEHMGQGLMMVDGEHKVAVLNPQALELLGLPDDFMTGQRSYEEVIACLWQQGEFGEDGEMLEPHIRDHIKAGALDDIGTYERTRPNGTVLEVCSVPLPGGGLVRTFTDITLRKHSEARIAHMARHDELTGLANRLLFRERIEQAIARSRRSGERFAVLLLDLDRFKDVNDTLGHPAGDSLLKIAAQRLCRCVRETDAVARLGGDEFAIVQTAITEIADTEELCRRVVDAVKEPYKISGHAVDITTSIGIAVAPGDGFDAEDLLKKADLALYAVKLQHRGGWRFFERAMEASANARRALENDLRKALKADQFEILYQPMIDLATNAIAGFEALLRWHHPARGLITPGEFIPVAEEIGLIGEIGEWVLSTACAAAVKWPGAVKIAVNLSPAQFKERKIVDVVRAALSGSGLAAERLELEITESVILAENQSNLTALQELRMLGAGIALDDFGTGYSSLSHLRAFPFTKIKIDKSFVMELSNKPDCLAIVRAVAELGKSLNVPTIAEGVETRAQLEQVRAAGCKEAQGFLFSRPMAVGDVEDAIASRKVVIERAA